MTTELRIEPVPAPWFHPGEIIAFPSTGEIMCVTAVRRKVVRRLGFTRPRRSRSRPWPRVRYTGYIDIIRGNPIP